MSSNHCRRSRKVKAEEVQVAKEVREKVAVEEDVDEAENVEVEEAAE